MVRVFARTPRAGAERHIPLSCAGPATFSTPGTGLAAMSREIVSKDPVRVRLSTSSLANNGLGLSAARTGFAQDRMENVAAAKAIFTTKHITALPVLRVAEIVRGHAGPASHRLCPDKRPYHRTRRTFQYQCRSAFRHGRERFPTGWACDRPRFASRHKQIAGHPADLRRPAESGLASAPRASRRCWTPAAAPAPGTRAAPGRH